MKISGIIAEYNPFHSGHALHLQKTCEITGADHIICVMSGNFVQRGEPAITDKWQRTKMALACGADIVLELPFLFATQSAEGFASGGVRLLDALRCVDYLSFGSESGDINALSRCAALMADEPPAYSSALKAGLCAGLSFPKARYQAAKNILGEDCVLLRSPNNILAVEYMKALRTSGSAIQPVTILRQGGGYSDDTLYVALSGASAIRKELVQHGLTEELLKNIPAEAVPFYRFDPLHNLNDYFRLLLFRLRSMDISQIAEIFDVTEGLEHRILKSARIAQSMDEMLDQIKSKRYTRTRLMRILLYCLTGVTKDMIYQVNADGPAYARVLGFRKEKESLLSYIVENAAIPILTKPTEFLDDIALSFDIYATDVYSLLHRKIAPAGRDYIQKLIVM